MLFMQPGIEKFLSPVHPIDEALDLGKVFLESYGPSSDVHGIGPCAAVDPCGLNVHDSVKHIVGGNSPGQYHRDAALFDQFSGHIPITVLAGDAHEAFDRLLVRQRSGTLCNERVR